VASHRLRLELTGSRDINLEVYVRLLPAWTPRLVVSLERHLVVTLAVGMLALSACKKISPDLSLLACDDGKCLNDYVCHPETNLCVSPVSAECAGGSSFCPSTVTTGSSCPSEGSFIPCVDGVTNCDSGCRTCTASGTWSECTTGTCDTLGQVATCATCGDDCLAPDHVTAALCVAAGGRHVCEITGCSEGWADQDGNAANGCETVCIQTNGGAEICDGLDNDCNGPVDDMSQGAVDSYCNGLVSDAHVSEWSCVVGACVVSTCTASYWDVDKGSTNGCEYACTLSNGGVESCDGQDNDCNGAVDDAPQSASGCTTYFLVFDNDGYGVSGNSQCWCKPTGNYRAIVAGDCADGDAASYPGASEACDGNDNDCSGSVPANEQDGDGDYYVSCSGWADTQGDNPTILGGLDCADADRTRYPGAAELCDGKDNGCTGSIPVAELDHDSDGYVECTNWQGGGDNGR
jgi:hypothetical protein